MTNVFAQKAQPVCSDGTIIPIHPDSACHALLDYALKGARHDEPYCIPMWVSYCNKNGSGCYLAREILKQEKSWVPESLTCQ